ncbi:MAG: Copper Transporter integral membrane protein that functions in high affinity copper transport [Watsoniomyces obsoletus]|nr:MAG: Copper Transporter integral membrane protein that functions in high affinity copper transport [Watsoniomyces obsoletus]
MPSMTGMSGPTTTSTGAASRATGSSHSMGGGGGMSGMSGMGGNSCKISMLWNWYTIDSCFIARSWRIRSRGAFAGSCIGVILLVIALEFLRRSQREFDRYVRTTNQRGRIERSSSSSNSDGDGSDSSQSKSGLRVGVRAWRGAPIGGGSQLKLWQQMVRSLLYMVQFAVGYFIMLLAMYYNGYIIISIFIGAFLGAMIFQWDTISKPTGVEQREACCA